MSDSKDDNQNYDVGYKKPPMSTQFKKGQSGNKNGRPKGSLNMNTILNKELNVAVSVTRMGKKLKIKKKSQSKNIQKRSVVIEGHCQKSCHGKCNILNYQTQKESVLMV